MCRFVAPFLLLFASSCLVIGPLDGNDGGPSDAGKGGDGAQASDAKGSDVDGGGDFGCVVDPFSRVTLCTVIGHCPGLAVDHDRFPNCGFRAGTGTISVECFCDQYICPLGASLTCGQAKTVLATQYEITACSQVSEGRCAPRSAVPPTGGSCDKNCAATCGADLACRRLCGC
jgi:hypothetical protein